MSSSAEAWLMLLAAGLYLYDSLLLLQHDELVVIKSTHKHWRAGFGANGWKIARKEPLLLNPLAPWQSAARIAWNPEGGLQAPGAVSLRLPDVGVLPRVGVTALWVLMFAVLPACLFAVRHSRPTLHDLQNHQLHASRLAAIAHRKPSRIWRLRRCPRVHSGPHPP